MFIKESQNPIGRVIEEGTDLAMDLYRLHKMKKKVEKITNTGKALAKSEEKEKAVTPEEMINILTGQS